MSQGILEYKLKPSQEQCLAIDEAIRTTQFLRNRGIRVWEDTPGTNRTILQRLSKTLAQEFPFVTKLNASARQAALDRSWSSIKRFYDNCRKKKPGKKGYPRYKHDVRSVEYKTSGWKLSEDRKTIKFTDGNDIGKLEMWHPTSQSQKKTHHHLDHYSPENIKRVRIIRQADGYYVQFLIEGYQNLLEKEKTGNLVAIDVGSSNYLTDHQGQETECPQWLKKQEKKLKKLQREHSRKQKGSQRRERARIRLAKAHLRISRQRKDFAIKQARALHMSNDIIFCENLDVQKLMQGKCRKSMANAGLGGFFQWLHYYSGLGGAAVVDVEAAYSTWECWVCGDRVPKELSQRWHHCHKCDAGLGRDHNSALVILKRGFKKIMGSSGHEAFLESLDPETLKQLEDLEPLGLKARALVLSSGDDLRTPRL